MVEYLDNNATTPLDPRVLEVMMPFFTVNYGNPNSKHLMGCAAAEAVRMARKTVADMLQADPVEIYFTSGATESNNLALIGAAKANIDKGSHIITSKTEHASVLHTCEYLESIGFEVTYLPVDQDGIIDPELVKASLRKDTIIISLMYVNNETGVIQKLSDIGAIAKQEQIIFMSDCTQAIGKIPIDVDRLGLDLLTFSGHKMYGPLGIGVLYRRHYPKKVQVNPVVYGGGQESGLRSGTLNVPGIVGIGKACEIYTQDGIADSIRIKRIRDDFEKNVLNRFSATVLSKNVERVANTSAIMFTDLNASNFVNSSKIFMIGCGSACHSATLSVSHVYREMGLSEDDANSVLRFSFGRFSKNLDFEMFQAELNNYLSTKGI